MQNDGYSMIRKIYKHLKYIQQERIRAMVYCGSAWF